MKHSLSTTSPQANFRQSGWAWGAPNREFLKGLFVKEIPLTRGYVAFVDDADYARVVAAGPWHVTLSANGTAYAIGRPINPRRKELMHRFILGISDPKILIDHSNHYGLDNQRSNLRITTKSQNSMNAGKHRKGASRFRGVYWHKKARKWSAEAFVNGKKHYLGLFVSELEAARARDAAAQELHKEFARLNLGSRKVKE